jgi:hypothetical protein
MSECTSKIQIGKTYRFDYPPEFKTLPEYTAHAGQPVVVLRALAEPVVDWENGPNGPDPMFKVRATDGWEGDAWSSELEGEGA